MRPAPPITEAETAEMVALARGGATYSDIARKIKRSVAAVRYTCQRYDLESPRPCKAWTRGEMRSLAHMRNLGAKFKDIAEVLGRSPQACSSALRRNK